MNHENLKKIKNYHIHLLHCFLKEQVDEKMLKENELNDYKEINQWKYVLFKYIIRSNESLENDKLFFNFYLDCYSNLDPEKIEIIPFSYSHDQIVIFEFIRDYLELKKDNTDVEINQVNLNLVCTTFLNNLENLNIILESFHQSLFKDYLKFDMDINHPFSINFKLLLCLVDILSILLPIKEYREYIFKIFIMESVLEKCYNYLKISDYLYDTIYKRNKIKENTEGVPESNIFYCFQTNIFKLLANYFFTNFEAKKYYLDEKNLIRFYYLLNHMKLDRSNPFKKEWTVLVVKALCEGKKCII